VGISTSCVSSYALVRPPQEGFPCDTLQDHRDWKPAKRNSKGKRQVRPANRHGLDLSSPPLLTANARKLTGGGSRPVQRMVGRTQGSYSRIWLWLHRAAVLYCTADLPVGDRKSPSPRSAPPVTKIPLGPTRLPTPRPVRKPGSLAAAKRRPSCIVGDWIRIENVRSELRSNSRARPREFGTRVACSTTVAPESRYGFGRLDQLLNVHLCT
jgi:hypothetical protein